MYAEKGNGYNEYPSSASTQPIIAQPIWIPPKDYVMASILAAIFCCWPIGVFAILRAMECRDCIYREKRDAAVILSQRARNLTMWSIGIGVLTIGAVVAYCVIDILYLLNTGSNSGI